MVKALYAHSQWLEDKKTILMFRNEDHDTPSPLDEVRMIQALHFPELAKQVLDVQGAQLPVLEYIGNQRISRMKDQDAWIKTLNEEPFLKAYRNYLVAVSAVTEKCRELLYPPSKS